MVPESLTQALGELIHWCQQNAVQRLVLGLSGGMDSMVLLHLCHQFLPNSIRLEACYIHHGLQAQASDWQSFCDTQCQQRCIPFQSISVQVVKGRRQGLEANARQARYQALYDQVAQQPHTALLTAHHQRDQAETLLLNLARGTGVAGLAAMPKVKPLPNPQAGCWHLRPLLSVAYTDLHVYAQAQALSWVEDPSNQSLELRRNLIRHQVLPAFQGAWPTVEANLVKTAQHLAESLTLLNELTAMDLAETSFSDFYLILPETLSLIRAKHLVRYWAKVQAGVRLPENSVEWVMTQWQQGEAKKIPTRKLAQGFCQLLGDRLFYFADFVTEFNVACREFSAQNLQFWQADWLTLEIEKQSWPVTYRIQNNTPSYIKVCTQKTPKLKKQLKQLWREKQIPPWDRLRWPVVCDEQGQCIGFVGLVKNAIAEKAKIE